VSPGTSEQEGRLPPEIACAPVVTGSTRVVGIIGDPVEHSLSPLMHNRAFRALGLDYCYVPFRVRSTRLAAAIAGVRALGLRGLNVTLPHKTAVVPYLDRLEGAARWTGAVNTIVCEDGLLVGDNTDGEGFIRSLAEAAGLDGEGLRVVVVGAGGAARAIAVALARRGAARLAVANRTLERARQLAELVGSLPGLRLAGPPKALALDDPALADEIRHADLLVQATSCGMGEGGAGGEEGAGGKEGAGGEPSLPVPRAALHPGLVVCEIVYHPLETPLVRAARAAGCRVVTGDGMLVHQGAVAFERWTGRAAPVELMRATLLARLQPAGRRAADAEGG